MRERHLDIDERSSKIGLHLNPSPAESERGEIPTALARRTALRGSGGRAGSGEQKVAMSLKTLNSVHSSVDPESRFPYDIFRI